MPAVIEEDAASCRLALSPYQIMSVLLHIQEESPTSSAQVPLLGHSGDRSSLPRRKRPAYFVRIALFSSVVIIVALAFLQPDQRSKAYSRLSALQKSTAASSSLAAAAPPYAQSCELCHVDPTNALCQYGEHNIRLSRAFEGSGYRLQRFLRKMVAGEEVQVGVLGASITQGHSVLPGEQTWQEAWFADLQKDYPNVKMHVGAVGATDSQVRLPARRGRTSAFPEC